MSRESGPPLLIPPVQIIYSYTYIEIFEPPDNLFQFC